VESWGGAVTVQSEHGAWTEVEILFERWSPEEPVG
jgi:hypothetical protein